MKSTASINKAPFPYIARGTTISKSNVRPSFLQNSLGGGSPPALHEKCKFPPGTTSVSPGITRKYRFESEIIKKLIGN